MEESIVQRRVAELIRVEISQLLARNAPQLVPGALLTVSVVRVTADLEIAKIYVSALPDAQLQPAVEALNAAMWSLRKDLAARIRNKLRKMPELRFLADDTNLEAARIDHVLSQLRAQGAMGHEAPLPPAHTPEGDPA